MSERKPIPGFPGYAVTETGEVWSCRSLNGRGASSPWHQLKPYPDSGGYLQVVLSLGDGSTRTRKVHKLILETFVGPCPEGMQGCHRDGNKLNNRANNLRWGTVQSNHDDKQEHGTVARGSRHGRARLSESAVKAIRKEYRRYRRGSTAAALGRKYGAARSTVAQIRLNRTWTHLVIEE
jgi:hypothetical protein